MWKKIASPNVLWGDSTYYQIYKHFKLTRSHGFIMSLTESSSFSCIKDKSIRYLIIRLNSLLLVAVTDSF